jgi:hypothetical protein
MGESTMKYVSGQFCKYAGRICFVAVPFNENDGTYHLQNYFTGDVAIAKPEHVSDLDPDVMRFMSLISFAPQLTHDEIKKQIELLFKGKV